MKAAVLHQRGAAPRYEDFPDPTPNAEQILVHVKAVALENVDKAVAAGTHYASSQFMPSLPAIVGFDGIGALDDGRMIGFGGMTPPYGAMAEKVVIPAGHFAPVPAGIDPVIAAALPASTLTSLFPLKWAAKLEAGETVLVNGATGVSGRLAVQVAKLLGAGHVVGTGRNEKSLQAILDAGADAVVDLKQSDDDIAAAFTREAGEGYDVILDFLWGHPTELLLKTLVPRRLAFALKKIRLIQIGEMAGATLNLPADTLRTSGLEIYGGGANLTPESIGEGTALMWDMLAKHQLSIDIEQVPLRDIESAWSREVHGKRLVIVP